METVTDHQFMVRIGIVAFMIASFSDVIIAWALRLMYDKHLFSGLSTYFRVMHATIMGIAVFSLVEVVSLTSASEILLQVERFNTIWLIGLFFFGFHLVLLSRIARPPRFISLFLFMAGVMYSIDTVAHFLLPNYSQYADIFLTLVAVPSIVGEMAFGLWLLVKGGKENMKKTVSR